jgi:hypothetical protein
MTETLTPTAETEAKWAKKQVHLTDLSTGLTGAGAAALGLGIAGKSKAAGKVLPKKLHRYLQSGKGDDVRNSVALASMVAGTASGVNWSKKLRRDADPNKAVVSEQEKALNLAKAWVPSTTVRGVAGALSTRRASFRGPAKKLARPKRLVRRAY